MILERYISFGFDVIYQMIVIPDARKLDGIRGGKRYRKNKIEGGIKRFFKPGIRLHSAS